LNFSFADIENCFDIHIKILVGYKSLSYIDCFLIDSVFKKSIHFFAITDYINICVQRFFQILFYTYDIKEVLFFQLYNNINITVSLTFIACCRTKQAKRDYSILFSTIFLECSQYF